MSYILQDEASHPDRRRTSVWVIAVVVVVLVVVGAFVVGRFRQDDHASQGTAPQQFGALQWVQSGGAAVPQSARHGPFNPGPGLGYSQDTAGAVLAAVNRGMRTSPSAPSSPSTPQRWWYRLNGGSPQSGNVSLSLLAETPQTTQMGGYARRDLVLRWDRGNWEMAQPSSPAQLERANPQQAGYAMLGGP